MRFTVRGGFGGSDTTGLLPVVVGISGITSDDDCFSRSSADGSMYLLNRFSYFMSIANSHGIIYTYLNHMKQRALLFLVVFLAAFAGAVTAKKLHTPQYATIERPLIDNLTPWKTYSNQSISLTFSYPGYLTETQDGSKLNEHELALFNYQRPRTQYNDHPYIKISAYQTSASLQDHFLVMYSQPHYCEDHQPHCHGTSVPTPIVINGQTALQFRHTTKDYRDKITLVKYYDLIFAITNHSTPEGTIPDATYNEMLKKMKIGD